MAKVGIITPVYNASEYLAKCIDSILNLSFDDWKLVLVDDGSTDGSDKICDYYSSVDDRITAIHKTNKGVSSARNLGLERCNDCEYITFVDADDYVNPEYLDILALSSTDCDIIFTAYIHLSDQPKLYTLSPQDKKFQGPELIELLNHHLLDHQCRTPWAKIFRCSLVEGLTFNDKLRIGEDTDYCLAAYSRASTALVCNNSKYTYKNPPKSKYHLSVDDLAFHLDIVLNRYFASPFKCEGYERGMCLIYSRFVSPKMVLHHPIRFCKNPTFKKIGKKAGISPVKIWWSLSPLRYYAGSLRAYLVKGLFHRKS